MNSTISRRKFVASTAVAAAAIATMPLASSCANDRFSDKIKLGYIGLGRQGVHLMDQIIKCPETVIIAGSDVNQVNLNFFKNYANKLNNKKFENGPRLKTYSDFRDLIANEEVDAVVIATPDHWHAYIAVEAAKAGKDIYCEKPLASTIVEGRAMVNAARKYNTVFQTGNMQRSMPGFKHACELVRNGYIGEIKEIKVAIGGPYRMFDIPVEDTPEEIDWEMWIGPAAYRGYNHILAPIYKAGDKQFFPKWRNYKPFGGGGICDWGAHMFDIAQWGIGMDKSAPVKFTPPQVENPQIGMRMEYDNGVIMTHERHREKGGVLFIGTKGTVQVHRQFLKTEPAELKDLCIKDTDIRLEHSTNHYQNWVDAIKDRTQPICDVEIGHSTSALCNVVNITYELGRELEWDIKNERFINDDDANQLLHRPYRGEWKLEV